MKTIRVKTSVPYDVMIGSGLLAESGKLIAEAVKSKKTVVVSDDTVYGLYGEKLMASLKEAGFTADSFVFPHGESSKSHKVLIELYDYLTEKNITRSDSIIALGGGVTGDLTGFAAATYLRGIDFVQVPTTLLAQVDSSVGGKTAVNINGGKNLVGAFKQPKLVIADTDTLDTLSDELFADGMGEVVKYGMIFSEKLFELLETGKIKENIEAVVSECVDIKRFVVETDEFDTGLRMTLNFGHTIGHAIEKIQNFCGLSHGAAVSVGMYIMTCIAEKGGLITDNISDRLRACLITNNMPYQIDIPNHELYKNSINDKKRFSDTINIIVCRKIGKAEIIKMKLTEYEELLK